MPERNGAAVDIHFLKIETKRLYYCQRLRCKRFVQLDHIDLVESQSGELQYFRNRKNRTNAHLLRWTTGCGICNEPRQWFRTQTLRAFGRHYHCRRGTVRHLRRIAGRDRSLRVECRLQLRESFTRAIAPDSFIPIKYKFTPLYLTFRVQLFKRDCQGHCLVGELVCIKRGSGTLV